MGRREQREQIFKLLFRVEFNTPEEMPQQREFFLEQIKLPPEEDGMAAKEKDITYITDKFERIQDQIAGIDRLIDEKAEGWSVARMGKVELTILRLGVFEILYDQDIPDSWPRNTGRTIPARLSMPCWRSFCAPVRGKNSDGTQRIYSCAGQCVYQKYVHAGLYAAGSLCKRRSE